MPTKSWVPMLSRTQVEMLFRISLESEIHGTLIHTVDLGLILILSGQMLIKLKFHLLTIKMMVLSSLNQVTSSKPSTISKLITSTTIGPITTMKLLGILLVQLEPSVSLFKHHKNCLLVLISMTTECIHLVAKDHTQTENLLSFQEPQQSNQHQYLINLVMVSFTSILLMLELTQSNSLQHGIPKM